MMKNQVEVEKPKTYLNVRQVAERLNVVPRTVYDFVRDGRLRAYKLGDSHSSPLRFDPVDVEDLLLQRVVDRG